MSFMSVKSVSKLVLALALASVGVAANAQATGTLNLSATVQATCVLDTVNSLDFGTYTQGAGNIDVSSTMLLTCGTGIPYNVRLSGLIGAAPRTLASGANSLQYQLFRDAGRSQIWGATDFTNTSDGTGTGLQATLTVYGRVADSAFNQAAASGVYNGTVTVTVAY